MSHNLEHQKVHTRMVKEVLKAVARANNHPYQSVFTDFIAGHPSCTACFCAYSALFDHGLAPCVSIVVASIF